MRTKGSGMTAQAALALVRSGGKARADSAGKRIARLPATIACALLVAAFSPLNAETGSAAAAEAGVHRAAGSSGTTLVEAELRDGTRRGPLEFTLCENPGFPDGTRCGWLEVPEDRQNPGLRTLRIRFAVIPATGTATDDPLVILPGGPGLGGVQSGPGTVQLFAGMRENREILLVDQRGTGASNALHCPPFEGMPQAGAQAAACRDALASRADVRKYLTREAVLDLEAIREELGYAKLDLFGMSYGTRLALDYLRLFPDRVGEVVIRAAAPVEMRLPLHTPREAHTSFERMAAACGRQPDCAERFPRLEAQLRDIVRRLRDAPATYRSGTPGTEGGAEQTVTLPQFASALFFLLYIQDFYVRIPPLLDKAAGGDFGPIMNAVAPFTTGTVSQLAWGLRWSVICNEDVRHIRPEEVEPAASDTFMGPEAIESEITNCAAWPAADLPADYMEPVASAKPVLIISGAIDPVAGPTWGEAVARTLPNSLHLTIAGASHLPPFPGCTGMLVRQFLDGTALPELDARCAVEAEPPRLAVE